MSKIWLFLLGAFGGMIGFGLLKGRHTESGMIGFGLLKGRHTENLLAEWLEILKFYLVFELGKSKF